MAKQKIILRVHMTCDKCRKKAKKITALTEGVISLAIEGEDRVVVVGEGIDAATLVSSLRKKVKHTDIISIEEVKPEDGKKKEEEARKKKEKQEQEEAQKQMSLWAHLPPGYSCNYGPYPLPPPSRDEVVVYGNSMFPNTWFTW
uniref:HMA domain-containing protein n=1 Tax=Kalanchoe fedtschenkoi TaxID=63787 RepID=A0A7N0RCV3_KALFE